MSLRFSKPDELSRWSRKLRVIMEEIHQRTFCAYRTTPGWQPNVNLYAYEGGYHICIELAGVMPGSLEVECVDERELIIAGQRPRPGLEDVSAALRLELLEIDEGVFERRIELSAPVDPGSLQVRYQEGYAWITLCKSTKR